MLIPLTQGKVAQIDDEDWPLVASFKWHTKRDHSNGRFYAYSKFWDKKLIKYEQKAVSVQFFLAGTSAGTRGQVDAQALRHAIGPVGLPDGPTAPERTPYGRQLRFVLPGTHLGPPPPTPLDL